MKDDDCVQFLQWALPRLHMRWPGFRKVRKQVCKHINRRRDQLGLSVVSEYQQYLLDHEAEWLVLDDLCRVTISRFYRDRQVFNHLINEVLPELAEHALARHATLRIWCAGCGMGEEPYTFAIAWQMSLARMFPQLDIEILATDANPELLKAAALACYPFSAVKNLPESWRDQAFMKKQDHFCLEPSYTSAVRFMQHDVRTPFAQGPFDLICCRNLAFTYFDEALQARIASMFFDSLLPGGVLLLGVHERLPPEVDYFQVISQRLGIYHKPGS